MKKLMLILFLLSLISVSGCSKILEPENKNQIEVTYTRSGGFIPYQYRDWHDIIIVKNDGTVIKDYKWDKQELKEIKLSKEEIDNFKELVLKADVFNLDDSYDCENNKGTALGCIIDTPFEKIEFNIDGKTKSIYMLTSTYAPKELRDIVEKIYEFKGEATSINVELNEEFELKVDQSAFIQDGNIKIRLLEIQDSRCPANVQCAWEGEATVLVNINLDDDNLGNFELTQRANRGSLAIKDFNSYKIKLVKVEPYPQVDDLNEDKIATFVVYEVVIKT